MQQHIRDQKQLGGIGFVLLKGLVKSSWLK